jgi:N-carbamoyl-L-amino-acid hydrolase
LNCTLKRADFEAEAKTSALSPMAKCLSWTQITIIGKDAHTGSPMPMRKNADWRWRDIGQADQIALSPHAVGAAGHIDVFPNSRNVIPGIACDSRLPALTSASSLGKRVCATGRTRNATRRRLNLVGGFDPVTFDVGRSAAPK